MSGAPQNIQSIAVIGAGIIGLSCALELADRGLIVTLYDKAWPPRGASWAAAGMLAPAFEAASEPGIHPCLFELCEQSAQMWPDWSDALEVRTGLSAGYRAGPSLAVAIDKAQERHLSAIEHAMCGRPDAPRACPMDRVRRDAALGGSITAALLLPSDGQADNRRTLAALAAAVEQHPRIIIRPQEAPLKVTRNGLDHAGHDATLICAGWGTPMVTAIENGQPIRLSKWDPVLDEIEAYGGQMLAVAPIEGAPETTIRCGDLYIVPKEDRIIIGATTERGRVLEAAEDDVIAELKSRAAEICPVLAGASVIETWAGVRPGTADHAPILGELRLANLFVASGHYRNGILLAPISAKIMADLINDGEATELARAFFPQSRLAPQV